jgi:hypothetical protein
MKSIIATTVIISILALYGCQQTIKPSSPSRDAVATAPKSAKYIDRNVGVPLAKRLLQAEARATIPAKKILKTGRNMTLVNKEIVRGSCWDYADTVYQRAGFSRQPQQRQIIFKGSRRNGPYADIGQIKPGDFLYYINHSYGGIEHSAIFIDWEDKNKKMALMLSYGGENRKSPARYRVYNLSHVYHITRPKEI